MSLWKLSQYRSRSRLLDPSLYRKFMRAYTRCLNTALAVDYLISKNISQKNVNKGLNTALAVNYLIIPRSEDVMPQD